MGSQALSNNTGGTSNTASGAQALFSNLSGSSNSATGYQALFGNTGGDNNTATGAFAVQINSTGNSNTATGEGALFNNRSGNSNTATGTDALANNKTGSNNTATGVGALENNSASANTAYGAFALFGNTGGTQNTGSGFNALVSNTLGSHNTATGFQALQNNTTGNSNAAYGAGALNQLTTGNNNTAQGQGSLKALTTGSNNIALGFTAGQNLTTGGNNIEIGNVGVAGDANTIRIGKQGTQTGTFIAGIAGVPVTGTQVVVNSTGKLGVAASSARFKEAIKPMDKASEAILALNPVTFRYKEEVDSDHIPQFGLLAEEVEKVQPELVLHDERGKPFTVRYDAVNAMLLNEFLKEYRKVEAQEQKAEELQSAINALKNVVARQEKKIDMLAATVQKVSDQLEVNRSATKVAANDLK